MNETIQTILQRHSTRSFQQKQVPGQVLELILKAGVAAPSAMNSQKWLFTAVQKPELLQRLCKAMQKVMQKGEDYCFFYGAPTLVMVSFPRDYALARQDCGAAMENMFLAAQSLGVSTCWINQLLDQCDVPELREILRDCGIPENHVVIASAAVGYGQAEGGPTPHEKSIYRIIA